ncbi:hypothetical protein [Terrabacter sp. NPDC080008]|uniref:hypothetical protein n=1 Tax=Terrabacter sp. NPDC080008 TaxID=3155176 RepID=UPI00345094B0
MSETGMGIPDLDRSDAVPEPTGLGQPYEPRINGLIPGELGRSVKGSIERWKQGDALLGGPLFWAGPRGSDPYLPYDGAPTDFHVSEEPGSGFLVLTSQTCDIVTTGTGAKHPLVNASPVYRLARDDPNRGNAKAGRVAYLVPVTRPPGDDGDYVVDLRVSLPLSKGILVGATPVNVWATERDRLTFAETLARKYRRGALSSALSEALVSSLNEHIKVADVEFSERVEELRLRIEGDRLLPTQVQLMVLTDHKPDSATKKMWRGWTKKGAKVLKNSGITLLPTIVLAMDDCSARSYKNSVPLYVSQLGRPPTW